VNQLDVAALLLFLSAGVSYYLFNFTTLLGPYGTPGDVYHEVILGGLVFVASVFVLLARKAKALEV
jgi:hypothetical protein